MAQISVIVSDTSAIIDLQIARLLQKLPLLPYTIVIPAPLFENELLDFSIEEKNELRRIGFEVRHLPGEGVKKAMEYSDTYVALSLNDCFALAVTEDSEEALLLTGDKKLRKAADKEMVETRGVLWAMRELHNEGICSTETIINSLNSLQEDPCVFIPNAMIKDMMNSLQCS